jgi:FAD-dependent urate hydroxylase
MVAARHVIVAVGIAYFLHMPAGLAHLPTDVFSHTSDHHDLSRFKGCDVTVIGGGSSALDVLASLLEVGAEVQLIARQSSLRFNVPGPRPWWKQWHLISGLSPGWRNQFYEHGLMLFRRLPQGVRLWIISTALGPAGGFSVKDRRCAS